MGLPGGPGTFCKFDFVPRKDFAVRNHAISATIMKTSSAIFALGSDNCERFTLSWLSQVPFFRRFAGTCRFVISPISSNPKPPVRELSRGHSPIRVSFARLGCNSKPAEKNTSQTPLGTCLKLLRFSARLG